jgi:hypothetical protein
LVRTSNIDPDELLEFNTSVDSTFQVHWDKPPTRKRCPDYYLRKSMRWAFKKHGNAIVVEMLASMDRLGEVENPGRTA